MASDAFLQGLAGFGTGFIQGFSNQMSSRLEREADKRQAEWLANLDKKMRDTERQERAGQMTAAFDAVYEYEQEEGPLPAPTPGMVSSRDLFNHTKQRVYAKNRPLLETGQVNQQQFQKLLDDGLAEEMGRVQKRGNAYLTLAAGNIEDNPAAAAEQFAEASKYSQDGISTEIDPATGLLIDVDERTMERIGAPYQLTKEHIARRMLTNKQFIAREDEQAQQAAIQTRFEAQQTAIQARHDENLAQRQKHFEEQEARLKAAAEARAGRTGGAGAPEPGSFKWMQEQHDEYQRAGEDIANAIGLTGVQDELDQIGQLAGLQELPPEMSLRQAQLQEQARVLGALAEMGRAIRVTNMGNVNTRPAVNLLMRDLADARRAISEERAPSRGKGRLLVGKDIQVTDEIRSGHGGGVERKLEVNGQPIWMDQAHAHEILSTLPRAKGTAPPPTAPAPAPAPPPEVPISVAPTPIAPTPALAPVAPPLPVRTPAPPTSGVIGAPSVPGMQPGVINPLGIY